MFAIFADLDLNPLDSSIPPQPPVDTTPPTAGRLEVFVNRRNQANRIAVPFSEDILGGDDLSNYALTRRVGSTVHRVRLSSASYDAATHQVILLPLRSFTARKLSQYTITIFGEGTIQDQADNRFDGDSDGNPGGDFILSLVNAVVH